MMKQIFHSDTTQGGLSWPARYAQQWNDMMASKARKKRSRKIRRQNKAALKHGKSAKPIHKLTGGRTGSTGHKIMKSRQPK